MTLISLWEMLKTNISIKLFQLQKIHIIIKKTCLNIHQNHMGLHRQDQEVQTQIIKAKNNLITLSIQLVTLIN